MNFYDLKKQAEIIKMSENMKIEIISQCFEKSKFYGRKNESHIFVWVVKKLAAAIIAVMFLFTGVSALVINVPEAYYAMYYISPEAAQFLMPVEMSCIKNGIKMNVESILINGSTAKAVVSLQDLTDNRIDSSVDLNDSYGIFTPIDCASHCKKLSYSEEEKKAVFLVEMESLNGENFENEKITFMINSFLSGKETFTGTVKNIDLSAADRNPKVETIEFIDNFDGEKKVKTILAQDIFLNLPVNNIEITGYGYVDEKLHIQITCENYLETNSYLQIYLNEQDKPVISFSECYSFDNAGNRVYEYIFEDIENPENCQVFGRFFSYSSLTKGSWKVTFVLEENG